MEDSSICRRMDLNCSIELWFIAWVGFCAVDDEDMFLSTMGQRSGTMWNGDWIL
jgi:hypothetical protein